MLYANTHGRLRIATCVTALAIGFSGLTPAQCLAQEPAAAEKAAPAASAAAEAAAKASPDLVDALSKELGASPAQAAGAAGSLFGVAKSRLKPEEFKEISQAVPGMDSLLKAAPTAPGGVGTAGALGQLGLSAAGLANAASAFSKLGLKPELVAKAVAVLTQFVGKSGGAKAAGLLASVLK
jgi:Protein of unknown function VcgC/VcgE (DUF2780)